MQREALKVRMQPFCQGCVGMAVRKKGAIFEIDGVCHWRSQSRIASQSQSKSFVLKLSSSQIAENDVAHRLTVSPPNRDGSP
jgi:hypothetical protein